MEILFLLAVLAADDWPSDAEIRVKYDALLEPRRKNDIAFALDEAEVLRTRGTASPAVLRKEIKLKEDFAKALKERKAKPRNPTFEEPPEEGGGGILAPYDTSIIAEIIDTTSFVIAWNIRRLHEPERWGTAVVIRTPTAKLRARQHIKLETPFLCVGMQMHEGRFIPVLAPVPPDSKAKKGIYILDSFGLTTIPRNLHRF